MQGEPWRAVQLLHSESLQEEALRGGFIRAGEDTAGCTAGEGACASASTVAPGAGPARGGILGPRGARRDGVDARTVGLAERFGSKRWVTFGRGHPAAMAVQHPARVEVI